MIEITSFAYEQKVHESLVHPTGTTEAWKSLNYYRGGKGTQSLPGHIDQTGYIPLPPNCTVEHYLDRITQKLDIHYGPYATYPVPHAIIQNETHGPWVFDLKLFTSMLFVGLVPDDAIFFPEEIEYCAALSTRAKDYMRDLIITDAIAPHYAEMPWANYRLTDGTVVKGHGRHSFRNREKSRKEQLSFLHYAPIIEKYKNLHSVAPLKGFRMRAI